jgi:DNA replication protein DnaC
MLRKILAELKMKGALQAMENVCKIEGKEEFTLALLQAECDYRHQRALERRLNTAKFPTNKGWDEIDPKLNPKINFKEVQGLGSCEFITKKENLCLMGQQGTGKSHSLIALGRQACDRGFSVKFYTACALVNALEESREQHKLSKLMQDLVKPSLLVIDELGFVPFSERGASLLFDVFASRYERGSIAVSTNLSFDKWVQIFGSIELTAALVDRFTHRAHIHVYEGESVRLRQARNTSNERRSKQ